MADRGCMDDFLSTEIDENKVTALVGSLESQLASPTNKEVPKVITCRPYNNNHIGGNASTNASHVQLNVVRAQSQPQSQLSAGGVRPTHNSVGLTNKAQPQHVNIINSMKGNVNSSQIIGISSIINSSNAHSTTNTGDSVTLSRMNNNNDQTKRNNSPSIRIVANNTKLHNAITHGQIPPTNQYVNASAMSQNVTIRPSPTQTMNRVNISSSGASSAMHNLATLAAEQKPGVTVLPNGSAILPNKAGSVIPHQIVMKSDSNHAINVKGCVSPYVKNRSDIPNSNSVIQVQGAPAQVIRGSTIHSAGGANSNIISVRPQPPSSQQQVVIRPSVATTVANASSSLQVVNASSSGTPSTIRPVGTPQIRQNVRIPNPIRINQPNVAPRQPTSQGTITIPPGALLMKNESGQIVIVSAPQNVMQQQISSTNSVITTISQGPYRVPNVRPLSSQSPIRAPSIVTIQPSAGQPQPVRAPAAMTSMVQTLPRPAGVTGVTASSQVTSSSINNNQTMATSVGGSSAVPAPTEMNKPMLDNVKKCKNFLSTLIKLAHSQPAETVKNVQALIQGLIDGRVEPENFTERLQHELQSSPQPYLVPFLKSSALSPLMKSLPLLRQCMQQGRMTIEGVNPPPLGGATAPRPLSTGNANANASTASSTPSSHPSILQSRATPLGLSGSSTLTHRPVGQNHLPQQKVLPSLGPASSKMAPIRQPMATQLAIAPGGNKVMVPAQPRPRPAIRPPHTISHPPFRSKAPVVRPSQASSSPRMPHTPVSSSLSSSSPLGSPFASRTKPEASASPVAAVHREKRKFESLKDGDDDINDVATMGGVNLSEESKNILATTNADSIGAQVRSCKEEVFLSSSPLLKKMMVIAKKFGIEEINPQVINLISHATQERLRDLSARLSTVAEHRVEMYKLDNRYELESETKMQLKFMEELDKLEKKRHEEREREKLLRAIKSRSKNEDPEQLKLKQKAKELQLAEAEEIRQKEANQTALAAIGPRKKRKLDLGDSTTSEASPGSGTQTNTSSTSRGAIMRPRIKRVNMKDLQFVLENEKSTRKSNILYKSFLK